MTNPQSTNGEKPLPLAGVKVLAVENFLAAPFATMWLGDAGADVIKIEMPGKGDQMRQTAPLRPDADGKPQGFSFLRTNRNKRSVTLDLKTEEGKKIFKQLAAKADMVVENFRPGVMSKLGLGWTDLREINPRLIYVAVSGFGQPDLKRSPYSDMPAFDIVAQAMTGLMMRAERTSEKPVYFGVSISDVQAGIVAAHGAVLALLQRQLTGEGQLVDVAMYDSSLVFNELSVAMYSVFRKNNKPGVAGVTAPFGTYKASDGWVVVAVLGEDIWKRFTQVIGQPELVADERFSDGVTRYNNSQALNALIDPWLAARTRAEIVETLSSKGVPVAVINDASDIMDCPHAEAREMLQTIEDPVWGTMRVPAFPIKMSGMPHPPTAHPPKLGEHTQEVLGDWLGLGEDDLAGLRERKVI
ncbi:CaiB/BaiF CoA transferase family protein [Ramlibacter sp.]|uniref:CaiB/BaiF CoA transferase family protein n=1 Tax=Ramlibacter sp. TaxID=1917967 RepID=UPI003D12A46D